MLCGADLVELCDVWVDLVELCNVWEQSCWDCAICGAVLVELIDIWGRVGGIV